MMKEEGKEKGRAALVPPKESTGHFQLLVIFLSEFLQVLGRVLDLSWSIVTSRDWYILPLNVTGWWTKNMAPDLIIKIFSVI